MARIMHVITGLGTGGAEMMLFKLLSESASRHEQLVVSLMDEGTTGERIAGFGIKVECLRMREGRPSPMRAVSIRSITSNFAPDLIVGWMYHGNLMATMARKLAGSSAPVLWSIRQSLNSLSQERRLTRMVIRICAVRSRGPAAIIYNSRASAAQHEAFGYSAERRVVIPNGIDCRLFHPNPDARTQVRQELGLTNGEVLVGLVARYHPVKDHAGFLRAVALVAEAHPSARFALIGRGVQEQPELAAMVRELGIQKHLFLLGERFDIPRLNAAFDLACSASSGEGFSNAIAEAMACGVPCAVTDVGESAYLVGDTGLAVPSRDPGALAQAINQLISAGPEHRLRLGAAARVRIEDNFSLAAAVAHYEALYKEHLSNRA